MIVKPGSIHSSLRGITCAYLSNYCMGSALSEFGAQRYVKSLKIPKREGGMDILVFFTRRRKEDKEAKGESAAIIRLFILSISGILLFFFVQGLLNFRSAFLSCRHLHGYTF